MKESTENKITCYTKSGYFSRGHCVDKEVSFISDGTWEVKVGGKSVDLTNMYIDERFQLSIEGISLVFECVNKIQLCCGIRVSRSVIMTRYHTLDTWQSQGNSPSRSLRSIVCMKTIPLKSKVNCCRTCQKMTFSCQEAKRETVLKPIEETSSEPFIDQIKRLFPQANDSMVSLLIE